MLSSKLQYSTGLKYSVEFIFKEEAFVKELKNVLGLHYSDFIKDKLVASINDCLLFSDPRVIGKWTNLMKASKASEDLKGWGRKKEVIRPVAPKIQPKRVL